MLGGEGVKQATETAILNANYMKELLQDSYKILYTGKNGRCAHEMILDCNSFKMSTGVEVADIATRQRCDTVIAQPLLITRHEHHERIRV